MLTVKNVSKKFSGVIALEDICMNFHRGEVSAIIGENGAGKSTLMKILSGVYPDYEGEVVYKGKSVSFNNPKEAQECGIAIIHQELNLIPYLTIVENIFLGRELISSWGVLDRKKMKSVTKELLERLKFEIDPDTIISDLKVGQQQVVEIAKALLTDAEVIIMDEPTSAISEKEVAVLFSIIVDLKNEDKSIIYISHKLDELFKIADRFIVLRDGRVIESGDIVDLKPDEIIQKMVGRKVDLMRKDSTIVFDKELISIQHVSLKSQYNNKYVLKDISFKLSKGEVLGIFGLMGSGRTELLETIFGLHPKLSDGFICIEGQLVRVKNARDAIKVGLALVPEDRKKDGLVLDLDVRTNMSLTTLEDMEWLYMVDSKAESKLSDTYISELKIKLSSVRQAVKNLSGGNQQKVVIAKWLATNPKILLLDEPTRGIDVNAKNEIYKLIKKLSAAGLGIIMVSSELPEILAISDRVLVMAEGSVTAEFPIAEATDELIMKAAIPKTI